MTVKSNSFQLHSPKGAWEVSFLTDPWEVPDRLLLLSENTGPSTSPSLILLQADPPLICTWERVTPADWNTSKEPGVLALLGHGAGTSSHILSCHTDVLKFESGSQSLLRVWRPARMCHEVNMDSAGSCSFWKETVLFQGSRMYCGHDLFLHPLNQGPAKKLLAIQRPTGGPGPCAEVQRSCHLAAFLFTITGQRAEL